VTTVVLPQVNFDDIQEIRKETNLDGIELIFVSTIDEVLGAALIKNPFKKNKVTSKSEK